MPEKTNPLTEEITSRLRALASPEQTTNQIKPILTTAIKTSVTQGQMTHMEAALCNWLINNFLDTFLKPYKLGFKEGFKEGERKAFESNKFRKEFEDLVGWEWPGQALK